MRPKTLVYLLMLLAMGWRDAPATAQIDRWELGKRLERFERAWQTAASDRRAAAAAPMQLAVRSFFGLQLTRAARQLDEAYFAVRTEPAPTAWDRAAIGWRVDLSKWICDREEAMQTATLNPYYGDETQIPADCQVIWQLAPARNPEQVIANGEIPWAAARSGWQIPLNKLSDGDFRLHVSLVHDGLPVALCPPQFSRIADWKARLSTLEQAAADKSQIADATLRATLAELVESIRAMAEGRVAEIDFPAAAQIEFGEGLVKHAAAPGPFLQREAAAHDLWLTLAIERRRVPIRLRTPPASERPWPVLVLFHGAGGSENMFFENYGAGQAVAASLQRGWLVVAPRQGLGGLRLNLHEILELLSEKFPIDRQAVYLCGHSMGAAQVVTQAQRHPELVRAAAAMGGGGRLPSAPESAAQVASIPWFVAAGELDFGRAGAQGLARGLKAAGAQQLTYRDYPQVEHMVIVQAALDDVFSFFDQVAAQDPAVEKSPLPAR